MRAIIAAAIVALSATLAFLPSAASASSLEDAAKATYKLYSGDVANCSAVAVSKTQLVTAAHCISPNMSIRIYNEGFGRDGKTWEVRSYSAHLLTVVRTDKPGDVAFLELVGRDVVLNAVDIAPAYTPKFGDRLMAIGYPRVAELTLTDGMFTALVDLSREASLVGAFYKTTVPVTGGSSGGALVRDFGNGDFKLIGLATAAYRDVSFQSYFSTVERLNAVVAGLLGKVVVAEAAPPLPADDMATDAR